MLIRALPNALLDRLWHSKGEQGDYEKRGKQNGDETKDRRTSDKKENAFAIFFSLQSAQTRTSLMMALTSSTTNAAYGRERAHSGSQGIRENEREREKEGRDRNNNRIEKCESYQRFFTATCKRVSLPVAFERLGRFVRRARGKSAPRAKKVLRSLALQLVFTVASDPAMPSGCVATPTPTYLFAAFKVLHVAG